MLIPDYVIGLGGAGREMAKTFLTQEWIMEQAVTQDDSLNAYFIDSDTNIDLREDVEAIENVRDEVYDYGHNAGVNAYSIHLVDDLSNVPTTDQLLSADPIRQMANEGEIDAWWLEDDPDFIWNGFVNGVGRRRGLGKALYHYCRVDDDGPFSEFEPKRGRAAIMVGLGGGTGSGIFIDVAQKLRQNGVSVDLFATIPGSNPDTPEEWGNAYAALTEIEQLALNSVNPFESVILIPEEPYNTYAEFDRAVMYTVAGYYNTAQFVYTVDGRMNEEVGGAPSFAPFTFAVPQVITYPGEQFHTKKQNFTRKIQKLNNFQEQEQKIINKIVDFIETHYPSYKSGLLDVDSDSTGQLTDRLVGEKGLYEGRFDSLRELLQSGFVGQAGYRTDTSNILTMTDDWLEKVAQYNEPSLEQMIETLESLADYSFEHENYEVSDEAEAYLNDFIEQETKILSKRTALLQTINDISDPIVARELKTALSYDKYIVNSQATHIQDLLANFEQNTKGAMISELVDVRKAAVDERDKSVHNWHKDLEPEQVSCISDLDKIYRETAKLLNDLDNALREFKESAKFWTDPDDVAGTKFEFNEREFAKLDANLKKLDITPVRDEITETVKAVKNAGRVVTKSGGLLRKGPDRADYVFEKKNISAKVYELPHFHLAVDDSRQFEMTYNTELIDGVREQLVRRVKRGLPETETIQSKQETLFSAVDDVLEQVYRHLDDLDTTLAGYIDDQTATSTLAALGLNQDDVPSRIGRSAKTLDSQAFEEKIYASVAQMEEDIWNGYSSPNGTLPSDLLGEFEVHLTEVLVGPIEQVENNLDTFMSNINRQKKVFSELSDIASEGDIFTHHWPGMIDLQDISDEDVTGADSGPDQYIHEIEPVDNARLTADTIDESGIWFDKQEKDKLKNTFYEKFHEALDSSEYLPLEETNIQPENPGIYDEQTSYKEYTITVTYLSRVFDGDDIVSPERYDEFEVSPRLGATDRTMIPQNNSEQALACPYGDAWDFAGVAFVGRVFLDNISPVRSNYSSTYDKITGRHIEVNGRDDLDQEIHIDSSVIRHALGIDGQTDDVPEGFDGVFYRRKKFIQFDRDDSLANLLDLTAEEAPGEDHDMYWDRVTAKLREDFVERNGFVSTRKCSSDDN